MTTTLLELSLPQTPVLAPPGVRRERTGSRDPLRMRGINLDVRKVVRSPGGDRIPFFCECAEAGCYLPLWLTLPEFDVLARGDSFGIAPGHLPPVSAIRSGA